jgi:hypothetical protein
MCRVWDCLPLIAPNITKTSSDERLWWGFEDPHIARSNASKPPGATVVACTTVEASALEKGGS